MQKPLVFAFLFYFIFQLFLIQEQFFLWFMMAFFVVSIIGVYRVSEKRGFLMILPLAFAFGSLVLFTLVTGKLSEQIYILLASFGFFMTLVQTSKKIRKIDNELWYKINTSLVFIVVFIWSAGFYGFYLNFKSDFSFWPLVLLNLLVIGMLYYYAIKINELKVKSNIFILFFVLVNLEIIWALSFTHFGHLTIGAALLLVNYVAWDIVENYAKQTLNRKIIAVDTLFFTIIMAALLLTTKWLPVSQ